MTLVVDASVPMGWCFGSEADAYTDAVLHTLRTGDAIVPGLWSLEVANVLLVAERRRRISRADADRFLGFLAALPITVTEPENLGRLDRLMALARAHRLTAYDAAYLTLASTERAPLATRDHALRTAAEAAGVALFSP